MKVKIFVLVSLISFIIVTSVYNLSVIDTGNSAIVGAGYALILFMFIATVFFVENGKLFLESPKLFRIAFIFGFFALWSTLYYHEGDMLDLIRKMNGIWQWIFCLMLGYIISFKSEYYSSLFTNLLLIMSLPIVSYYIYNSLSINLLIQDNNTSDVPFILLVLFPFALTLKKEFIKTIAILFIGVIAMLSFKRTTIFGFLMMTVSYYYMVLTMSKISSKKRFMIFSVGVVACFFLYQIFLFIEDKSGGHIIERLNSIQEDQGSGRLEIYAKIIDILSTSSVDELLFGRGYLSVLEYADVLAHNDFLQIIFDFGLIALVLYFVFFYQLLKYIGKIYKSRNISNINYPAFNAGIVAFIFLGMFNCFITSPVYYSTLMLYFGLAIGGFEREKIKNRLLKNEKKS